MVALCVALAEEEEEAEGIKLFAETEDEVATEAEDESVCVGAATLDVGEVIVAVVCPISVAPRVNAVVD